MVTTTTIMDRGHIGREVNERKKEEKSKTTKTKRRQRRRRKGTRSYVHTERKTRNNESETYKKRTKESTLMKKIHLEKESKKEKKTKKQKKERRNRRGV